MTYRNTDSRLGHPPSSAAPPSPFPQRNHPRQAYEHSGDVAMNRDDDRRDRGRSDRRPRGPPENSYDRTRSPSPAPKRAEVFRDRDLSRDDRRDREKDHSRSHYRDPRDREDIPSGPRRRSRSPPPSPGKRRRSPSPAPHRKRSRRERGDRRRSRKSRSGRQGSPFHSDRPDLFDPPVSRPRSRSPPPREPPLERGRSPRPPLPRSRRDSHLTDRSRSPPRPDSHHSALSRAQSPHQRGPPTGPSGSRKKAKRRDRDAKRGLPSSGANSIEVNMNRRADVRGSLGSNLTPNRPSKTFNDYRYNQSPSHVTSGSSHHGSPLSQSPHGGGGRGSRNGPRQFSPPGGAGGGTASQFGQSSPPPPSGPMNPGRGFSRGGFRGGSFSAPRGGPRGGGFRQFGDPPTGPAADRGFSSRSGENTPSHESPRYAESLHSDVASFTKDDHPGDENSLMPLGDEQGDDTSTIGRDGEDQMMSSRAPPTGPAAATTPSGPKFSFAFKATSKAPVAAPKPEISQKFSAAPPRREPPAVDDRSNRDRDLPHGTPTEPASSRARSDYHSRQRPPEPPKTRMIKRIERRLKPKPKLEDHLATSESPFYRKPGNESVVGSGTYGKVFKGVQIYTGRLVALKKIRMEGERDGFPVTAVREIKLLQSLRHKNIVALQEVMVEKNDCFMVFEYLSHDLTGLLNHPSFKLDPAQKKHLAKQLFEGLDYLHTRGVLHRDIKAANILVSSDGILKFADFGLARFYAKHHRNDYTNRVITIWYRSPELLLGETQYTAAVDVWSAACVMVEIFTRHAIFPGDGTEINQLDKIYAILGTPSRTDWPDLVKMEWFELLRPGYRKPNVFAEKYQERVPPAAFELLKSMFQYDPAKRPTAAEVLEHPYFTTEHPPPKQAIELANIEGDWHEFESKALRREKERQEREARRAEREKDRKRPGSSHDNRDSKRAHLTGQ